MKKFHTMIAGFSEKIREMKILVEKEKELEVKVH